MILTKEIIQYAQQQLLLAGDLFGSDTPEELLWQIQELQDKLEQINAGTPLEEELDDLEKAIEDLNNLYS